MEMYHDKREGDLAFKGKAYENEASLPEQETQNHMEISAMSTPPPARCSMELYGGDHDSYHPFLESAEFVQSPWTAVVSSLIITAQRTQTRPEATVRLPPSAFEVSGHQTHDSRARYDGNAAVATESYTSKWQKRFDDLLADTDMKSSSPLIRESNESFRSRASSNAPTLDKVIIPASTAYASKLSATSYAPNMDERPAGVSKDPTISTVTHPLDDGVPAASIADSSDCLISEEGTSHDNPCLQEQNAETRPRRLKRRRREKQSGGPEAKRPKPRPRLHLVFPPDGVTVAQRLRRQLNDWEDLCHLMLDGISPNDRDILKQISSLVSRLEGGSGPIGPRPNISSSDMGGIRSSELSRRCHGLDGMYDDDQPVPGSPQDSLDSFHTVAEGGLGGGADESPYTGKAAEMKGLRGGEGGAPTVPQEDEQDRQARLERITSSLVMRRKEQPIEVATAAAEGCLEASLADMTLSDYQKSESSPRMVITQDTSPEVGSEREDRNDGSQEQRRKGPSLIVILRARGLRQATNKNF
ncbi:MAG: hypothetical protein Q9196_003762 [Gyalolechia fulgens]